MKISAIITAAGSGHRFGEKKQFKPLCGQSLYHYSLWVFLGAKIFDEIILVVPEENKNLIEQDINRVFDKSIKVIVGGDTRQGSVSNGVQSSNINSELVVIHDAARPFVTKELINASIMGCEHADGSIIAIPPVDTIKYSKNSIIERTIDRKYVWLAQTPQTFNKKKLLNAYNNKSNDFSFTDESSIMEEMGYKISIVKGSENNFKITTHDDWNRAEALIK